MFPSCAFLMQCCTLQEMEYGEKACATCGRPTGSLVSHGRTGWLRWWCSSREWPVCLWWEAPMSPTTVWAWGLGKPSKPCSCLVLPQTTVTGWSCQSTASTGLCRWPPFPRLQSLHHPSLWPLHTFPRLATHLWLDSLPQHLWLDSLPPPHLWLEHLLPQPSLQLWSHRRRSTKGMAHNMRKVPEHISIFFTIAFVCFNFWKNMRIKGFMFPWQFLKQCAGEGASSTPEAASGAASGSHQADAPTEAAGGFTCYRVS